MRTIRQVLSLSAEIWGAPLFLFARTAFFIVVVASAHQEILLVLWGFHNVFA
jgi:hypothetical protein